MAEYSERENAWLKALQGRIKPVPVPLFYRAALLLVALAVTLLPVVYIALIGLAGWCVAWHAQHDFVAMASVRYGVVLYLGLTGVGAFLVLFMIKPLFAGRARPDTPRTLRRQDQPLLFEFVDQVCLAVGAPKPREIRVNNEVNAAAGLRRGFLSLFLPGDLILIIGLPLAGGLDVRQFAGVLAHEFGHFSQAAGMRLSWLLRSINAWFARVVYERDSWDQWLVEGCDTDIRIGIFFYLARAFVWLTRRVLWVLMMVAHALSCYLLRQMEYDADRHEAGLAGGEAFASTARKLAQLNVASRAAQGDLSTFWREGRLADDLTELIIANHRQLELEVLKRIQEHFDGLRTGWFDTHPSDADRVASVNSEPHKPLFETGDDVAASALFRNFGDLCRSVTIEHYRKDLEIEAKPGQIKPTKELVQQQDRELSYLKAAQRFWQAEPSVLRPLRVPLQPSSMPLKDLSDADGAALSDPADVLAQSALRVSAWVDLLRPARERALQEGLAYREALQAYNKHDDELMLVQEARSILIARAFHPKTDLEKYKLPDAQLSSATRKRESVKKDMAALEAKMQGFEAAMSERMVQALHMLQEPALDATLDAKEPGRAKALRAEMEQLLPLTRALGQAMDTVLETGRTFRATAALFERLEGNNQNEALIGEIKSKVGDLRTNVRDFRQQVGDNEYPFDHASGKITLSDFLHKGPLPSEHEVGAMMNLSAGVINKMIQLYLRCVGHLAAAAEEAEAAAELPPLPEPPKLPEPKDAKPAKKK